jgi:hypothetical protein
VAVSSTRRSFSLGSRVSAVSIFSVLAGG